MKKIKNLTPHAIYIIGENDEVVAMFQSEGIARAEQKDEPAGELNGIPLVKTTFGEPVGLPEPEADTYLIVSLATANAAKAAGRTTKDLLLTSGVVRDEQGRIIGCKTFAVI